MKARLIDAERLKYEFEYIRPHLEEETRSAQKCIDVFAQTVDEQATIDPENLPIVKELREKLEQAEQKLRNIKYCYDIAKNGERQLRRQVDEITSHWAECAKRMNHVTMERDALLKELTGDCSSCSNQEFCLNNQAKVCNGDNWKWRGIASEREAKDDDRP